ncbi:MAG: putative amidophosphoribosyltransferase, partial [Roseivirga sp.]
AEVVNALIRNVASETQTRKSRVERQENVASIFEISDVDLVLNKRVLLVDDVLTTGATIISCGNKLIGAGVSTFSVAVIAATQ